MKYPVTPLSHNHFVVILGKLRVPGFTKQVQHNSDVTSDVTPDVYWRAAVRTDPGKFNRRKLDEAEPELEPEQELGPRPPLYQRHGSGVSRRALFFLPNFPGSSGDHELTANGLSYANSSCYLHLYLYLFCLSVFLNSKHMILLLYVIRTVFESAIRRHFTVF